SINVETSLVAALIVIRPRIPYGVKRRIKVTTRMTIEKTASTPEANFSAWSGCFLFTPIKTIPVIIENMTTEITEVSLDCDRSEERRVGKDGKAKVTASV